MRYKEIYERINIQSPKTINVVFPNGPSIFEALTEARSKNYINARLYGNPDTIRACAEKSGLKQYELIPCDSPEAAIWSAIADVRKGQGDALMKADISTAAFLSPVLNREKGLRKGQLLSHIAVCDSPGYHKLLFLTDGAINIELDLDRKRDITENAVAFCENILGEKPKIAFAALVEKINPKLPETGEAQVLANLFAARGYQAEGPMALDVILNADAARKKGIVSAISGDTDLIVFPNITVCNFMLKQMIELQHAPVGGLIMGAQVPLILLSRSDRPSEKLNSIALSLI
ncbi:MAG: phosphate butyryltransferase [Candidatus Marinimicrobia bacterium]|nr:phosphate butyryltransferase [Candidatus Neomarinimicrobiota bacterium]